MRMVERVARAIADDRAEPWDDMRAEERASWIETARAAIEAMREPVCNAIHCGCANYCDFDEAEDKIRSLFDAALKE